jgi:hypothetical protein
MVSGQGEPGYLEYTQLSFQLLVRVTSLVLQKNVEKETAERSPP